VNQVPANAARQHDLLDVAWEVRLRRGRGRESEAAMARDFWVDLSQAMTKKPWGNGLLPFRSRSQLYSFEANRCIDGRSAMLLLGWPSHFTRGLPASDLLSLAAEGTDVPLTTLIVAAIWANPYGSWNSAKPPTG